MGKSLFLYYKLSYEEMLAEVVTNDVIVSLTKLFSLTGLLIEQKKNPDIEGVSLLLLAQFLSLTRFRYFRSTF
jgi:hypothetical protein